MENNYMISFKRSVLILGSVIFLTSCNDDFTWIGKHDKPRVEYAPNMYYSIAYEPLKQVTDDKAGAWVSSDDKLDSLNIGEYYNSNPYNSDSSNGNTPITMREPVKGTIKRGFMPYHIDKDSLSMGDKVPSPLPMNDQVLADGQELYTKFCQHCHGETGQGDGPVSQKFAGVANISNVNKAPTEGHVFHVITWGKGMMGSHASQLNPEERWKIARYVKSKLQQPK